MAKSISALNTIIFDEAGGYGGPFKVDRIIFEATAAAGDYVVRGTNAADGPILISIKSSTTVPVVVEMGGRTRPGLYLSALPSGGKAVILCG
jgi:hypothetical protein